MTKIENQTAVTFTGETTKLPSGAIISAVVIKTASSCSFFVENWKYII